MGIKKLKIEKERQGTEKKKKRKDWGKGY